MGEPGTKELLSLEELEATAGARTGRKHILSILVENKPGVLTRISGLFARRGFNIDTLTVGPTDDEAYSRITLTLDGALHPIDQVTKQLHKLINVLKISDLDPATILERELVLIKVRADSDTRAEIMQLAEIFRAKIIDVSIDTMVLEVTGTREKVDALVELMRAFHVVELVRTGKIAMSRGKRGI
jgi:acetolactate synthase I/III small subunit